MAYDAAIQTNSGAPGHGMIVAVGGGTPGDTGSDFVLARFKTEQSGEITGGGLDADFGAAGATSTDFAKNQAYNTGQDVARRVRFAPSVTFPDDHAFSIVAAGFSGSTSAGGNLALAEYLPRNRIFVVSEFGFQMTASPPGGGTSTSSDDIGAARTLLSGGEDEDVILASAEGWDRHSK